MSATTSTASCRMTRTLARPCSSMRVSRPPTPGACTSIAEEIGVGLRFARSPPSSRPCRSRSRAHGRVAAERAVEVEQRRRERRCRSAAAACRARAAAPATSGPAAARSCASAGAVARRRAHRRTAPARDAHVRAPAEPRRSPSLRAMVAERPPVDVYSIASVSASFHVDAGIGQGARASTQLLAHAVARDAPHARPRCRSCCAQKSAMTRRCRSGDSRGSAGQLDRRPFARCSSVNVTSSPSVDVQHDGVDRARVVPEAVRAAAVDRDRRCR